MSPAILNSYRSGAPAEGEAGGHLYWRFHIYATTGANAALTAMAFKDGTGSSIATSGGTAIASGNNPTRDPSNLFDGSNSTFWEHSEGSIYAGYAWAGYAFATPQKVRQIGLQVTASMDGEANPKQGQVEWSHDGVTWNPLVWLEVPAMTNDVMMWFDFTNLIPAVGATDFGAHAYWRVFNIRQDPAFESQSFAALSAVLFKDSGGSSIATTGGTALASGALFAASNAFDSTDSTFWESNSAVCHTWIGYQFSSPKTVMQVGIQRHAATMDGSPPPLIFFAQYSDDGMAYANAAICFTGSLTNDVPKYFDLTGGLPQGAADFGSHAYWGILNIFGSANAISALLFKDDTGSSITTSGGSALESGHTSTNAAASAFDGTDSTFWESDASANTWLAYQFSSAKKVMQMALQEYSSMDSKSCPHYGIFMYSDDGVVWQGAGAPWPSTFVANTPQWFDFSQTLA